MTSLIIGIYLLIGYIFISTGDKNVKSYEETTDPDIIMLRDMLENKPAQYHLSCAIGIFIWLPVIIINWMRG
jgi:hypothetical protein